MFVVLVKQKFSVRCQKRVRVEREVVGVVGEGKLSLDPELVRYLCGTKYSLSQLDWHEKKKPFKFVMFQKGLVAQAIATEVGRSLTFTVSTALRHLFTHFRLLCPQSRLIEEYITIIDELESSKFGSKRGMRVVLHPVDAGL